MSEYDDLLDDDELTEPVKGTAVPEDVAIQEGNPAGDSQSPPVSGSVSVIKTPDDVPAALKRVKKAPTLHDRVNVDREWLERRTGKKAKR